VVWNIWIIFQILGIITPTDFHIFERGSNHHPDMNRIIQYPMEDHRIVNGIFHYLQYPMSIDVLSPLVG
jgi:hypothetical protein